MSIYEDDTHMILGLSETQGQVLSMYLRAKKCSQCKKTPANRTKWRPSHLWPVCDECSAKDGGD